MAEKVILDQWVSLLSLLAVVSAVMLCQARQSQFDGTRRSVPAWLTGGLVIMGLCHAAAWFMLRNPELMRRKAATGFGPQWSCQRAPKGGQVCVRDPAKF